MLTSTRSTVRSPAMAMPWTVNTVSGPPRIVCSLTVTPPLPGSLISSHSDSGESTREFTVATASSDHLNGLPSGLLSQ